MPRDARRPVEHGRGDRRPAAAAAEPTPERGDAASTSTTEAVASPESRTEPVASGESRTEPVASGESRTEPVAAPESRTEPVASGESRTEPVASGESRTEPVASGESRTEPVTSEAAGPDVEDLHDDAIAEQETTPGSPAAPDTRGGSRRKRAGIGAALVAGVGAVLGTKALRSRRKRNEAAASSATAPGDVSDEEPDRDGPDHDPDAGGTTGGASAPDDGGPDIPGPRTPVAEPERLGGGRSSTASAAAATTGPTTGSTTGSTTAVAGASAGAATATAPPGTDAGRETEPVAGAVTPDTTRGTEPVSGATAVADVSTEPDADDDPLPSMEPVPRTADRRRRKRALLIGGVLLLVVVLLLASLILIDSLREPAAPAPRADAASAPAAPAAPPPAAPAPPPTPQLPRGGTTIFPQHRVVAYYGSPGEPRLGVLGAGDPETTADRIDQAAAPFATPGKTVQPAMEIIVGVADGSPGPDGDYHHDVDRAGVERYVDVARAHKQLIILDIQPGRSDFLTAVKPWEDLLRQPDVSLALDAEWRMAPNEVPGKVIGQVSAAEINQTTAWLSNIVTSANLPQKLLVIHQFTGDMIQNPEQVASPPGLAMVQHVDGFGAPPNKLGKYAALQRPQQFHQGFKLFYTQDTPMLTVEQALALQPVPDLITYQ